MKQLIETYYLHPSLIKLKHRWPNLTANQITLSRLVPAGLAYITNNPWLYLLAALLDWIDGAWARANKEDGVHGRILDPAVDKLIVLSWLWALYAQNILPFWWVLGMTALDIVSQAAYHTEAVLQKHGANQLGKAKKVLQDACILAGIIPMLRDDLPGLLLKASVWAAALSLGAKFQLQQSEKSPSEEAA
ncbi:MAG: CDP-alcohol phosphatidyltransferase family protein [Patescibacteria group bacterium]